MTAIIVAPFAGIVSFLIVGWLWSRHLARNEPKVAPVPCALELRLLRRPAHSDAPWQCVSAVLDFSGFPQLTTEARLDGYEFKAELRPRPDYVVPTPMPSTIRALRR